jgi:MscS family membrane protein
MKYGMHKNSLAHPLLTTLTTAVLALVRLGFVGLLAGLLCSPLLAANKDVTAKEMFERDQAEIAAIKETTGDLPGVAADRSTPRRAILGITAALHANEFALAAQGLDMRYLPDDILPEDGPKLIKQLDYVFNRHLWVDMASLSDDPDGYGNDGLPDYRDLLGAIKTSKDEIAFYLQRIPDGQGGREWKISNATVAQIPLLWREFGHSDFAEELSQLLPHFTYADIDNWQWAYLLSFVAGLLVVASGLFWFMGRLDPTGSNYKITGFRHLLTGPLGLFVYIMLLREFMLDLGLSVKARTIFESLLLIHLAYIFLALGIIDLIAAQVRRRMIKNHKAEAVVIVRPVSVVVKTISVALIAIMGLDNAGYNVTTILAGLGVGSVAVALAAQKTLENLIGALTIYIARPFQPGDFCRIDGQLGVIEDIGLRSTQLRTMDRTVVDIPNGSLSSTNVENFTRRDGIRFLRLIAVRFTTSPDQMRYLLADVRKILHAHSMVTRDTVSVRLYNISEYAFVLRLDCRFNTTSYQSYLAIAEDLYLRIIDAVRDSGAEFALPSQRVTMDEPLLSDSARRSEVEALVSQWREQNTLPYPDWSEEYIDKINDTLEYPPSGTPENPGKITPLPTS